MIANKNLKEQTDKQVKKTTQGVMDGDQPLTPIKRNTNKVDMN